MKHILLLLATFLLINSFVFANRPKLYCEILNSDKMVDIQSHLLWDVDANTKVPGSFISGNDTVFTENFKLGKNSLKVKLFFPKQESGRRLNATTTIYVTIYLNDKEIINTKHFGQHSQDFVKYELDILCRPNRISVFLNDKDNVQIKVQGEYIPKNRNPKFKDNLEKKFLLNYSLQSTHIDDVLITKDVLKYGPLPTTLNHVEETIIVNLLDNTAIYMFKTSINNLSDSYSYEWGVNSFLFCTDSSNESELVDLFNTSMYEYSSFSNQSTIRIFDPDITYYANDILINSNNITKTGRKTYKISNITDNHITVNGLKILNPINQKMVKISLRYWDVKSVEVGENTTYKKDDIFIYFYGDGLSRLNYTIEIREKK